MKKSLFTKSLTVVALVAAIVGLVCITVSMLNLGNSWPLIAGQICVIIGMIITVAASLNKKKHQK